MIDALTFYKDLNSLVAESEYEDAEVLCAHLNAFLSDREMKMQTEVLQTDKLEERIGYLESELRKVKEMREQFNMPDCNLVYKKQLQVNIEGDVQVISASIRNDMKEQLNKPLINSSVKGPNTKPALSQKPKIAPNRIREDVSFLDIIQTELLLGEFENILNIKRGKMMSALKVEQIYDKVYLIESIVEQCSAADQSQPTSLDLS